MEIAQKEATTHGRSMVNPRLSGEIPQISPWENPSLAGPDVAMVDDLVTDIVLGPAVSKEALALEILAPGSEARPRVAVIRSGWRSCDAL